MILLLVLSWCYYCTCYQQSSSTYVIASPFVSLSAGSDHNCFVDNKIGRIKCYGLNSNGQLGYGDTDNRGDDPNEMGNHLPFVDLGKNVFVNVVSCGMYHTCTIVNNHESCKCWGGNQYGQLGLGLNITNVGSISNQMGDNLPYIDVGNKTKPIQLSLGMYHTCILFENQMVKCLGNALEGQLGYEDTIPKGFSRGELGNNLEFVNLGKDTQVISMHSFSRASHSCALLTTQLVKCWGYNYFAQLGYNDTINRGSSKGTMGDDLPFIILSIESRVKQISVGAQHTCMFRIDGLLICFGSNQSGQLGIGSIKDLIMLNKGEILYHTPVDISGRKLKSISLGRYHTCILFDDSLSVKCIGDNSHGQLGQGNTIALGSETNSTFDKISPIDMGTKDLIVYSVIAGSYHTCVVFINGGIKCFGANSFGNLGQGSNHDVGIVSSQLGSNLLFIDIIPTISPTADPIIQSSLSPTTASSGTSSNIDLTGLIAGIITAVLVIGICAFWSCSSPSAKERIRLASQVSSRRNKNRNEQDTNQNRVMSQSNGDNEVYISYEKGDFIEEQLKHILEIVSYQINHMDVKSDEAQGRKPEFIEMRDDIQKATIVLVILSEKYFSSLKRLLEYHFAMMKGDRTIIINFEGAKFDASNAKIFLKSITLENVIEIYGNAVDDLPPDIQNISTVIKSIIENLDKIQAQSFHLSNSEGDYERLRDFLHHRIIEIKKEMQYFQIAIQ